MYSPDSRLHYVNGERTTGSYGGRQAAAAAVAAVASLPREQLELPSSVGVDTHVPAPQIHTFVHKYVRRVVYTHNAYR